MADNLTNITNNGETNQCPPGFIKDFKTGNCITRTATTIPNANGGFDCAPGYTKYRDASGNFTCILTNEKPGLTTDINRMGLTKVADDIQYNASAYSAALGSILGGIPDINGVTGALKNLTDGVGNPSDLAKNLKDSLKLPKLPEKPKIPNLKTLRLRKKPDIKPKDLATPQKFAKAKELGLGKFAELKNKVSDAQNSVQGAVAKVQGVVSNAQGIVQNTISTAQSSVANIQGVSQNALTKVASKITDKMGN
jgi:hypothetical protein